MELFFILTNVGKRDRGVLEKLSCRFEARLDGWKFPTSTQELGLMYATTASAATTHLET